MEFKKVSIGDYSYGMDCGLSGREELDLELAATGQEDEQLLQYSSRLSSGPSAKNDNHTVSNFNFFDPEFEKHLRDPFHPNHRNILNFLMHLALCHTIVIQQKKVIKETVQE